MLVFNLKKEWFEKIKSGEKTHEYRRYDYWYSRIVKKYKKAEEEQRPLKICLKCGYPKKDDSTRILYGIVKKISFLWGDNSQTDLNIDAPIVDIEFELIKEKGAYKNE